MKLLLSRNFIARLFSIGLAIWLGLDSDQAYAATAPSVAGQRKPRAGIDTRFGDLVSKTRAAASKGDYQQAVNFATEALAMKPDTVNAAQLYSLRGTAYDSLHDDGRAMSDYNEAIRLDAPHVFGARANRGGLRIRTGEDERGISDLTAVLNSSMPGFAGVYLTRAMAYQRLGRTKEARDDFRRLTHSSVKTGTDYAVRGAASAELGDFKAATADLITAKRLARSEAYVVNQAAWFAAVCPDANYRDGAAAVRDATKACDLEHWRNPAAIDTLAAAYAEKGDFARALDYQTQALRMQGLSHHAREQAEQHLRLYQSGKPYRADWGTAK